MKTLPIVAEIIADLEIIDGEVLLSAERLDHWARRMRKEYWGREHRNVYLQLGGYALELATRRALAALQFEALAKLPDVAGELSNKAAATTFVRSSTRRLDHLMGRVSAAAPARPVSSAPVMKASAFMTPHLARPSRAPGRR